MISRSRLLRAKVQFFAERLNFHEYPRSDRDGWTIIGGLPPSAAEYKFAARSDDFAVAQLRVKLDDPKTIVERKVVMKRGVDVKGTVVCSDGKPAAGWKILALPQWWDFNSYPNGEPINDDGSFVLKHIGPKAHKVTISVPIGEGTSTSTMRTALSGADLSNHRGPLAIKIDYPSPGSMAFIEGHLHYLGGKPKQGFWVHANGLDNQTFDGGDYVSRGRDTFRIGPIPAGRYRLAFDSQEIEAKDIASVTAPAKDLQVEISVRGVLSLRGAVLTRQGKDTRSPKDVRVRLVKLRTLRGPHYVPSQEWRRIDDVQGRFSEQLPGPGVYVAEATADGFAVARSKPFNTDEPSLEDLHIELVPGVPLAGTVVDEDGRPINGATVISEARAGVEAAVSTMHLTEGVGVKTIAGRFQFAGLSPGDDTLHILHPDYAPVIQRVSLKPGGQAPLSIVMPRGGTIYGYVHDQVGRLASGVTLHFDRSINGSYDKQGRFATAVTDENGYYEVRHLPEQVVYVHREDEWDALGVVRQAILPANGKKRTLDFGSSANVVDAAGTSKVSGRVLVNGKPLADTKLLISGDNPNSSLMKAVAKTNVDGSFVFLGIPFGDRVLYYADGSRSYDWHRIRDLQVNSTARNFGRVEQRVATLSVHAKKEANRLGKLVDVALQFAPVDASRQRSVGQFAPRRKDNDPFVFEKLPLGKYFVTAVFGPVDPTRNKTNNGMMEERRVRQLFELTSDQPDVSLVIELPVRKTALRGTIDSSLRAPEMHGWITLCRKDESYTARIQLKDDGTFEATGLPEGEYSLYLTRISFNHVMRDDAVEVVLKGGETKTLHLSKELMKASEEKSAGEGTLYVMVFAPQGVPLPGCVLRLIGPGGTLSPKSFYPDGRVAFMGTAGVYELSASFGELKPVTQRVEIEPRLPPNDPPMHEVHVTLAPFE